MVGRSTKGAAWGWRAMALGAAGAAVLAALSYTGVRVLPHAQAQPAAPQPAAAAPALAAPAPTAPPSDYSQRPVAFLHDNEVVTREQLGEYLIARYGADKLQLLINKLLIEEACRAKGIEVTQAEVEAALAEDLSKMGPGVDEKVFVDKVLKQYKKTLYEWKEDVIRPKLLMTKLVRDRVKVTEEDIRAGFDAYHGEKIDCKVIYWPRGEERIAQTQYAALRDSDAEFDRAAKMQANPTLAANGGHITPPLGRHTIGNDEVEREAFKLQPGEMTSLINTPDGVVVVKCIGRIPADTTVSLEAERAKLYKEAFERKVQKEIPMAFQEIAKQANVKKLLTGPDRPEENLAETTQQLLNGTPPGAPGKAPPMPAPH